MLAAGCSPAPNSPAIRSSLMPIAPPCTTPVGNTTSPITSASSCILVLPSVAVGHGGRRGHQQFRQPLLHPHYAEMWCNYTYRGVKCTIGLEYRCADSPDSLIHLTDARGITPAFNLRKFRPEPGALAIIQIRTGCDRILKPVSIQPRQHGLG